MSYVVAAALLLAAGTAAAAEEAVYYMGAHVGRSDPGTWQPRVDFGGGIVFDGEAALRRGSHAGLMAGRQRGHLRYELEYERGQLRFTRLALAGQEQAVSSRGHYDLLFANAYRTDRLGANISSFVGGGIGWAKTDLPVLGFTGGCQCFGPADETGWAWQLRAGLAYQAAPRHQISVQYTYLSIPGARRDAEPSVAYRRERFGAFTVGYAYAF